MAIGGLAGWFGVLAVTGVTGPRWHVRAGIGHSRIFVRKCRG